MRFILLACGTGTRGLPISILKRRKADAHAPLGMVSEAFTNRARCGNAADLPLLKAASSFR